MAAGVKQRESGLEVSGYLALQREAIPHFVEARLLSGGVAPQEIDYLRVMGKQGRGTAAAMHSQVHALGGLADRRELVLANGQTPGLQIEDKPY